MLLIVMRRCHSVRPAIWNIWNDEKALMRGLIRRRITGVFGCALFEDARLSL